MNRIIFKSLLAAVSMVAAVCCSKQPQSENPDPEKKDEARVLVASLQDFSAGTKVALDGTSPIWKAGDRVLITDGTDDESTAHCREYSLVDVAGDPSNTALITNGGKEFEVTVPETFGKTVHAFCPACSYGGFDNEGRPVFIIPEEQDGSLGNACICVARTGDGDRLDFKNVVTLMIFPSKDTGISGISLVTSSSIAGRFVYDFSDGSVSVSEGTTDRIDAVLPDNNGPAFIAVAPGTLSAGTMFLFKDLESSTLGSMCLGAGKTVGINKIYRMGRATANMLPGAFSIDDIGNQVYFSKGNLWAYVTNDGLVSSFVFAGHQYDYLNTGGANCSIGSGAGYMDLFGWSSDMTEYGVSQSTDDADYSGGFVDWGLGYCEFNNISPTSVWRTLSEREFRYIINERCTSEIGGTENSRYVNVKIDGKSGVLLFPDYFVWSEDMGDIPHRINNWQSWSDVPSYSSDQFAVMQDAGAVFLPAAGSRTGNTVITEGGCGYLWLSDNLGTGLQNSFSFANAGLNIMLQDRCRGCSVRLVTDMD